MRLAFGIRQAVRAQRYERTTSPEVQREECMALTSDVPDQFGAVQRLRDSDLQLIR